MMLISFILLALLCGLRLFPEWFWASYELHTYAFLAVMFYWLIRTQLRRLLLKKSMPRKDILAVQLSAVD